MSALNQSFSLQGASSVDEAFTEGTLDSEAAIKREAKMDAITKLEGNPDQLQEEFAEKLASSEYTIRAEGLDANQRARASRNRLSALRGTTALQSEDPELIAKMLYQTSQIEDTVAAEAEISQSWANIALSTAEEEEFEVLMKAHEGDPLYDPIIAKIDQDEQTAALWKMAEDTGYMGDVGLGQLGLDILHFTGLPLTANQARSGVLDVDGEATDIAKSGDRLMRQVEAFRKLPFEEQTRVFPEILANLKDETDIRVQTPNPNYNIDYVNKTVFQETAAAYITGMTPEDADLISVMDSIDAIPFVAGSAYTAARSSGNLLKLSRLRGSRNLHRNMVSDEMRALREGRESPTGSRVEDVIEEVLPEAVNLDKSPVEGVSSGVDAMDAIDRMDDILFTIKENTPGIEALTPAELKGLVDGIKTRIKSETGRKVLDVQVGQAMSGSGVTTPTLKVIIGSSKNTGYKSPSRLLKMAKSLGLDPAYVGVRTGRAFSSTRRLSADEAMGSGTVKTTTPKKQEFDVRPDNDETFDQMAANLTPDDGVVLNPSKDELTSMSKRGPVKIIATREGNIAAFNAFSPDGTELAHQTVADLGGFNLRDTGRGSFDPKSTSGRNFDPDKPLESINRFEGQDESSRFSLRTTEPLDALSPEVLNAQRAVKAAEDRVNADSREVFDLQASRQDNFLRMQAGGGKRLHDLEMQAQGRLKDSEDALKDAQARLDDVHQGPAEVVQKADGMYYLEMDVPLNAHGAWTPLDKASYGSGPFARWFLSGRAAGDIKLMDLSTLSDGARSAFISVVQDYLAPTFKKLRSFEKRQLDTLAERMRSEEKWYTEDQAHAYYLELNPKARRVPQRWLDAVDAYRTASDMDYFVRNAEIYNRASLDGHQTVAVDLVNPETNWTSRIDETNARVERTPPKALSEGRIFDTEDGTVLGGDSGRAYNATEVGASGKYVVTLQEPITVIDNAGRKFKVKHVIADPQAVYARGLEQAQLPYKAGGSHVQYGPQVRVWAKQAQDFVQGDGGSSILLNPRTYVGGTRPSEIQGYVDRMNQAGRIAKRWLDGDISETGMKRLLKGVLDREEFAALPTRDDFIQQVKNYRNGLDDEPSFNPNYELEIRGDREMPTAYDKSHGTLDDVDGNLGGHESWMRTNQRMYYGRRGQRMVDAQGNDLPILDAFDAMDRGLNNVAKIAGGSAYQKRAAEQFLATFEGDLALSFSGNTNAETVLRRLYQEINNPNIWKTTADPKRVEQGKNQLAVAGRVANWDNPMLRRRRAGMIALANRLDASASRGNMFSQLASDAVHWSFKHDFGYGLRQMVFDVKLGLLNVAQVPMQISTALALSAVDPIAAGRAYLTYPVVRTFIEGGWSSKQLMEHMQKVQKTTGMKGKQLESWVNMVTELRRGKFTKMQGHSMQGDMSLNEATGVARTNPLVKGARVIRDVGRVPFNEAEVFNRVVAFQVAWAKMARKYGNFDPQAQKYRAELIGSTNDMAMNMTSNVKAANQSGVVSGATQFMAYPHRWLELMFTDNTSLSRFERARLIASQSALYGASGTFILSELSDMLKNDRGESPTFEDDFTMALMERGSLDALFYLVTGQDHRYADRAEVASFLPQLVTDFMGQSKYGDTSAMEFLGGASISIGKDIVEDLASLVMTAKDDAAIAEIKLGMIAKSEDPMAMLQQDQDFFEFTALELDDFFRNVSSYNNFRKAQNIWQSNQLRSKGDKFLAGELDDWDGWSALAGIPVQEQDILSAQMSNLKNRKTNIKDGVDLGIRLRVLTQSSETDEQRAKYRRLMALHLNSVDESIRARVSKDIFAYPITSMLEGTTNQMNKIKNQEIFVKALEEELAEEEN